MYEGRLCTNSLAVFGPGSLLCTRVDCVNVNLYSLAVFGPGSLLCTRVDCVIVYLQLGSLWAR